MTHRIGIIGGDGIGPEVVAEAAQGHRRRPASHYEPVPFDLGGARYLRDGAILPDEDLAAIGELDAVLLGAVGTPAVPPGVIERGMLLRLRFELDLYINLRPFEAGPSALNDGVDMIVIRENTEGTYAGEGGFLRKGTPHEVATQGSVNTRIGVERCVRYAFELAQSRERKHLTLVHKTNVLTFAGDLWERTFHDGRRRVPRRRHRVPPRRRRLHLLRAGPGPLRRRSSPTTCSATSSPTSAARSPAASAARRRATSTPPAPGRRCSSRSTARPPTSRAPARPIRAPRSSRPR